MARSWLAIASVIVAASGCRDRATTVEEAPIVGHTVPGPRDAAVADAAPDDAPWSGGFLRGTVVGMGQRDGHDRPLVLDAATGTWRALGGGDVGLFPTEHRVRDGLLCIQVRGADDTEVEQLAVVRDAAVEPIGPASPMVRNPTVGPDGTIVVETDVTSYRDLFAIDPRGKVRRLTTNREGNFEPALSPDGRRLAFASSRDGNAELYLQPMGNGPARRLTDDRHDDWGPTWSPDGTRLAFLSDRDGSERAYTLALDGGAPVRLTRDATPRGGEASPRWSPDGTRLALVRGAGDQLAIDLVELATGAVRTLTPPGAIEPAFAWSPDGAHLAIVRRGPPTVVRFVRVSDGVEVATVGAEGELVRWLAR